MVPLSPRVHYAGAVVIYGSSFCHLPKEGIITIRARHIHVKYRGWVMSVYAPDMFVEHRIFRFIRQSVRMLTTPCEGVVGRLTHVDEVTAVARYFVGDSISATALVACHAHGACVCVGSNTVAGFEGI